MNSSSRDSAGGEGVAAPDASAPGASAQRAGAPSAGAGLFTVDFEVRDSELDAQGIVNNANYLHYYEHARHRFLLSRGVDFVRLHEEGFDAIVYHIEVDYRESLRSGEEFTVSVEVEREGKLRLVFRQEIRKREGGRLSSSARVVTAIVSGGRPVIPPAEILARLLAPEDSARD